MDYQTKSESFLADGYQKFLERRQSDGSFNFYGETVENRVWLTAYVAKMFQHAKEVTAINEKYIADALNFIHRQQKVDGSFSDQLATYHYIRKTRSMHGVSLSAFVAIAFLENAEHKAIYKSTIDRAITYIDQNLAVMEVNYETAISAYALALYRHPDTNIVLNELKYQAIVRDDEMFWHRKQNTLDSDESLSITVETAAYAILAFVTADRAVEAIPIMKWLWTQRNYYGGFFKSTDTVLATQALTMMASLFHAPYVNMNIKLTYGKERRIDFKVGPQNAIDFQFKNMEQDASRYTVRAGGIGVALFQVSYSYNEIVQEPSRRFDLKVTVQDSSNPKALHLKICAKYIPDGDDIQSQLTIVEIFLPNGYEYDPQTAALVEKVGIRVSWLIRLNWFGSYFIKNRFFVNRELKHVLLKLSSFSTWTP